MVKNTRWSKVRKEGLLGLLTGSLQSWQCDIETVPEEDMTPTLPSYQNLRENKHTPTLRRAQARTEDRVSFNLQL